MTLHCPNCGQCDDLTALRSTEFGPDCNCRFPDTRASGAIATRKEWMRMLARGPAHDPQLDSLGRLRPIPGGTFETEQSGP